MNSNIKRYVSISRQGGSWKKISAELSDSFELGLHLFKRDFLVRYRQSLLGLSWALIMPIITTGVFVMLFKSGVIRIGKTGIPYPVYAFYGITLWQLFHAAVLTVTNMTPAGKALMVTVAVPRFAYLYSPVLTVLTDFVIRIAFLSGMMLIMQIPLSPAFLLLAAAAALPLIILGAGVGLFLTIVNSAIRDINNILHSGLQFLMFLSPVIYPVINREGWLGAIGGFNPLSYLIEVPRRLLFLHEMSHLLPYGIFAFFSAALFILGLRFYYLSISRILEVA